MPFFSYLQPGEGDMNNENLVKILNTDDRNVFFKLMEGYNKTLWVVVSEVLSKIGTVEDIEECICDVYISLWENPGTYIPEKGLFKTFITVTAKRKALEKYRKLRKIKNVPQEKPSEYGIEMVAYLPEQFEENAASIKNLFFKRAKRKPKPKPKNNKTTRNVMVAGIIFLISVTLALSLSETFRQFIFGSPKDDASYENGYLVQNSPSQGSMSNLVRLVVDEEGNPIPISGILRQKYVTDLESFSFIGEDGILQEIEATAFSVTLHSRATGEFEYIFYSLDVNGKLIAVPTEWDVMVFNYLVDESSSNFFACTDTGIYRIDPASESAQLISSEEYNGVSYDDLFVKFSESRGFFLTWIGNPILSPDGQWIAFQSNRNDTDTLPSFRESLWVLNTITGEQRVIPVNNEYSQVPEGFLWLNLLLVRNVGGRVEAGINLCVVELVTGASERVNLGTVPNAHISSIHQSGLLAMSSYDETGVREIIFNIARNGNSNVAFEIEGTLHYTRFSPCGRKIAAVLREVQGDVIDTILIIDTSTGHAEIAEKLEKGTYISAVRWTGSNEFLATENVIVDGRVREKTVLYTLR